MEATGTEFIILYTIRELYLLASCFGSLNEVADLWWLHNFHKINTSDISKKLYIKKITEKNNADFSKCCKGVFLWQ